MNQEKYTERMRGFLQSAQMLALREGHQRLVPDHLLKVLLDDPEGLAAHRISSAGGDSPVRQRAVAATLPTEPPPPTPFRRQAAIPAPFTAGSRPTSPSSPRPKARARARSTWPPRRRASS